MSKSQIVSKVMFFVSLALFLIFSVTTFVCGQKVAGSIYFIFFAVSVAFACLDRKYNSNFFEFYRYSIYLDDLVNILAVSSIIYYKQDSVFMIAVLSLVGVGLFVDLFAKNRLEKRRFASIMATVLNCVLMIAIFPYFFISEMKLVVPITAVVIASIVSILKIVLAVVPCKEKTEIEENKQKEETIEQKVQVSQEDSVE